jgi:hypothetical protein
LILKIGEDSFPLARGEEPVERDDPTVKSDVLLTERIAMEGARAFAERRTPVWTGK